MTFPFLCEMYEFTKSSANNGSPQNAHTFDNQSKCARQILLKKFAYKITAAVPLASAITSRPDAIAPALATASTTIDTHSSLRFVASHTGRRNSNARFFVQPSHIAPKLRYILVLTASDSRNCNP